MSLSEYLRPCGILRKVWSRDDTQQVVEDAALHALADKVMATQAKLPADQALDDDGLSVFDTVALELMLDGKLTTGWPDPIGDIIATWPAPIVCAVIVP